MLVQCRNVGLSGWPYSTCMWTKLYRFKAYRYLPAWVVIGSLLYVLAQLVIGYLL